MAYRSAARVESRVVLPRSLRSRRRPLLTSRSSRSGIAACRPGSRGSTISRPSRRSVSPASPGRATRRLGFRSFAAWQRSSGSPSCSGPSGASCVPTRRRCHRRTSICRSQVRWRARFPARAWRAIARGARVLSFDHGETYGTGRPVAGGQTPPWVAPAVAIARQLSANARLVDQLRPGPPVTTEPIRPPPSRSSLLDARRVVGHRRDEHGPGHSEDDGAAAARHALRDLDQLDRRHRHGDAQHAAGPALDVRDRGAGKALVYIIGKVQR